jgi:hypothetical protein
MVNERNSEEAFSAVDALWSPEASERSEAMAKVLQHRVSCAELLLSTLTDLIENPYPRFAKGREEEGARALEAVRNARDWTVEGMTKRAKIAREVIINSRLESDVIYLLGELKAEESIPILIRIMERRHAFSGPLGFTVEMLALSKIGSKAVVPLVESIRSAEQTASSLSDSELGFVDEYENGVLDEESEDGGIVTGEDAEEEAEQQRIIARGIQERALMVLDRVCDRDSVPLLEGLANEMIDPELIKDLRDLVEAIGKYPDRNEGVPPGAQKFGGI